MSDSIPSTPDESHQQLLAYFDSSHDCPEEIIDAAGFTPYKILGNVTKSNDPADQYLANFFCPAARSMLTEALSESDQWAGIIVAHGCDATNRHFDIWRKHVQTPFIYWVNSPMNCNPTGAQFFKVELKRMISTMEKHFGIHISLDHIKQAISESNQLKQLLKELGALRSERDIPNREYFNICLKAVQSPKQDTIKECKKLKEEWLQRPSFPKTKKKIMLTGSDITYVEWMDLLETANLRVIRDDLSIGERYFATAIPLDEFSDPLDAIVSYYFNIPRPATKNPPDPRIDYILTAAKETQVDAVLSQNVKFCEPYAFDAVYTLKAIKDAGIPTIHLEREYTPQMDQQLLTRLEAFAEMI